MGVLDPEVYGDPVYDANLWDTDVYGEWTAVPGSSSFTASASDAMTQSDSAARGMTTSRSASESHAQADSAARVLVASRHGVGSLDPAASFQLDAVIE